MDLYALALLLIGNVSSAHPVSDAAASEIGLSMAQVVAAERLPEGLDAPHTVALMTALGWEETKLRSGPGKKCARGALGEAGLWQLMPGPNWEGYTRAQICASIVLQAKLALHVLVRAGKPKHATGEGPWITYLCRAYTSGPALADSPQARDRIRTYRALLPVLRRVLEAPAAQRSPARYAVV